MHKPRIHKHMFQVKDNYFMPRNIPLCIRIGPIIILHTFLTYLLKPVKDMFTEVSLIWACKAK